MAASRLHTLLVSAALMSASLGVGEVRAQTEDSGATSNDDVEKDVEEAAESEGPAPPPPPAEKKSDEQPASDNPYDSAGMSWRNAPPDSSSDEKKKGESEESQRRRERRAPDEPENRGVADDTGHVIPTVSWGEKQPDEKLPFSVGGVTTDITEKTWFKFYGFLQTRYVTGKHLDSDGERQSGGGFSLSRARLFFYGQLTNWLQVLMRVGATSDGTARFEQAFADFSWRNFSVRVGQFYLPVFQEQALSPVTIMPLNFSAVGGVFDGGQTQGVRVSWDLTPTRLHFFVTDGLRTGFSEAGSAQVADVAVSTRVETTLSGARFGQFNAGSGFRGEDFGVLLGGGLHYQSGGQLTNQAVELGSANTDVTVKGDGYNLHFSGSIANTESEEGSRFFNYGLVTQAGIFVLPWTEIYGRYEAIISTETEDVPQTLFRGYTVGANQYIWPERGIRAIVDFVYYPDPTTDTPIAPDRNSGVFPSTGSQWSLRTEINVLF